MRPRKELRLGCYTTYAGFTHAACAACGWTWMLPIESIEGRHIASCSRCTGDLRHGKIDVVEGTPTIQPPPMGQQGLFT